MVIPSCVNSFLGVIAYIPSGRTCAYSLMGIQIIAVAESQVEIPYVVEFQLAVFSLGQKQTVQQIRINILGQLLHYIIVDE